MCSNVLDGVRSISWLSWWRANDAADASCRKRIQEHSDIFLWRWSVASIVIFEMLWDQTAEIEPPIEQEGQTRGSDWLTDHSTDWLTDWLTDWPTDWSSDWTTGRSTDWPSHLYDQMKDWPLDLPAGWRKEGVSDWWTNSMLLTYRLTDWLTWLTDWLADWLTGWLTDRRLTD